MKKLSLEAKIRTEKGKNAAYRLRQNGWLPAILYAAHQDPVLISIDKKIFIHILEHENPEGAIFDLLLINGTEKENTLAILKEFQEEPASSRLLHADFYRIRMDQELEMAIPLKLKGEPEVVKSNEAIIERGLRQITIRALPTNIPEAIEVDISQLKLGETLHLNNIEPPEGLIFLGDKDQVIVSVVAIYEEVEAAKEKVEGAPEVSEEAPEKTVEEKEKG